ncbi:hypothetical protein HDU86_005718 [Geranomyces michiganensis]|nr:hypothetical protein HDU86_005718 [Geranomyces michiganensis]
MVTPLKRARGDDELRALEDIVTSYQQQRRTRSLPYHCVLVGGMPSSFKSTIFTNKFRAPRQPASVDAAIEALATMERSAYSRLVVLVQEHCKDGGVSAVIHCAKAEKLLPGGACTNLLRETIDILRTISKRPVAQLLMQGTERTSDMWIWREFYDLLFLAEIGITIYFGELQAKSTKLARQQHNPAAVGRNEDWVITLESETSIGKRGVDIGIGDSLGEHEFDSETGREKICKSWPRTAGSPVSFRLIRRVGPPSHAHQVRGPNQSASAAVSSSGSGFTSPAAATAAAPSAAVAAAAVEGLVGTLPEGETAELGALG